MSSTNGTPITTSITMTDLTPAAANNSKGKGKAIDTAPPQQDMSMDEDEDSSDEETGAEDDVPGTATDDLDEEEDDLNEIDTSNILSNGRRTRGKTIDFAKAAEDAGEELGDSDEENDEDFEADGGAEIGDEDAMRE